MIKNNKKKGPQAIIPGPEARYSAQNQNNIPAPLRRCWKPTEAGDYSPVPCLLMSFLTAQYTPPKKAHVSPTISRPEKTTSSINIALTSLSKLSKLFKLPTAGERCDINDRLGMGPT